MHGQYSNNKPNIGYVKQSVPKGGVHNFFGCPNFCNQCANKCNCNNDEHDSGINPYRIF